MAQTITAEQVVQHWRDRLRPVTVGGRRSYVLDQGEGDPILLLHGIPTHAYLWRDVAAYLAAGRRVIAPDLLGFGFADKPGVERLVPAGQAAFLEGLLDRLGVTSFSLVVHDYGALVGCELLARNPDRVTHLTITNTSLRLADWRGGSPLNPYRLVAVPGVGELAFTMARPFMLHEAFKRYVNEHDRLDEATMALYWHPFENGFVGTLLQLARSDRSTSEDDFHRWREALAMFDRRALVAWGNLDPAFRPDRGEEIAGLLPQAWFKPFEHSNHFVPEDRPQALARLILADLEGHHTEQHAPQS